MPKNKWMHRVLCYGDSNTWGHVPRQDDVTLRYPEDVRWTGLLQHYVGRGVQIIEEGLNSRTTGLDDPDRPGRNGLTYLGPCLESHNPLDLVIAMLGSNDLKKKFRDVSSPTAIAERIRQLVRLTRRLGENPERHPPEVLLISPPYFQLASIYDLFQYPELEERCRELAPLYEAVAREEGVNFWDAGPRIRTSDVDGAHLDAPEHQNMAQLVYERLSKILDHY